MINLHFHDGSLGRVLEYVPLIFRKVVGTHSLLTLKGPCCLTSLSELRLVLLPILMHRIAFPTRGRVLVPSISDGGSGPPSISLRCIVDR